MSAPAAPPDPRTYRELLRQPLFVRILADHGLGITAVTVQGLGLSVLVYEKTNSPLLAALAIMAGVLPEALGGAMLLGLATRLSARATLVLWALVRAAVAVLLAAGAIGVLPSLALVAALGLLRPVTVTVQSGLMLEQLGERTFTLARSVLNVTDGVMQAIGFAVGGLLVVFASAQGALVIAAVLYCLAALVVRRGIPPVATVAEATDVRSTWRGNRRLLATPTVRPLLIGQWVPNGLIAAAEAQFVPYAGDAAGLLFFCSAVGLLAGDVLVGRLMGPATQRRAALPLLVLLAVPYLAVALEPPIAVAAAAVTVASVGYGSTLCLQARMLDLLPSTQRSQAFGLAYSGTMTGQGVMAIVVGFAAGLLGPAEAVGLAACASLLVTALLWRPLEVRAAPAVLTHTRHI